jgi:hypothetical protein
MQSRGEDTSVVGLNVADLIFGCDSAEKFGYRHTDLKWKVSKECNIRAQRDISLKIAPFVIYLRVKRARSYGTDCCGMSKQLLSRSDTTGL